MRIARLYSLGLALVFAGPVVAANSFDAVATVNGNVITEYDVDQRMKLLDALGAEEELRPLAMQQLTEDRVKLQAAESLEFDLPEDAVVAGLEEFAVSRGLSLDEVLNIMSNSGIDRQTMDDFIEAGIVWRELIVGKFRELAIPTDAEVERALVVADSTPVKAYVLAEIAMPFAERGEEATVVFANELYSELQRGFDFEVAARRFSRAPSAENGGVVDPIPEPNMPPGIRTEITKLSPGQVTPPIPITGGLAILRLVEIRQVMPERDPALTEFDRMEQMRQQLFSQRITVYGDGYLQELLLDAVIAQ